MLGDISRALRPAHPTSKSTDHKRWDTEIRMYAGVIRSAVHTRFRRGVTIAVVHSGFKPDKACLRGVEKMRPVTISRASSKPAFGAAVTVAHQVHVLQNITEEQNKCRGRDEYACGETECLALPRFSVGAKCPSAAEDDDPPDGPKTRQAVRPRPQ